MAVSAMLWYRPPATCPGGVSPEHCRYSPSDFAPVGSVGCARRLGFAGEADGVAADQKMCRETIARSQIKDNLSYLDRVADLVPPIRLQRHGNCAHRRFIV